MYSRSGSRPYVALSRRSSAASMLPVSSASTNASRRCCSSRASSSSTSRCAAATTSITASAHSHSVSENASTVLTSAPRSRASSPKRDQTTLTEIRYACRTASTVRPCSARSRPIVREPSSSSSVGGRRSRRAASARPIVPWTARPACPAAGGGSRGSPRGCARRRRRRARRARPRSPRRACEPPRRLTLWSARPRADDICEPCPRARVKRRRSPRPDRGPPA